MIKVYGCPVGSADWPGLSRWHHRAPSRERCLLWRGKRSAHSCRPAHNPNPCGPRVWDAPKLISGERFTVSIRRAKSDSIAPVGADKADGKINFPQSTQSYVNRRLAQLASKDGTGESDCCCCRFPEIIRGTRFSMREACSLTPYCNHRHFLAASTLDTVNYSFV